MSPEFVPYATPVPDAAPSRYYHRHRVHHRHYPYGMQPPIERHRHLHKPHRTKTPSERPT
jgi:hypothetical protein